MKVIYNRFIPFKGFKAINLFGIFFVRKEYTIDETDIRHESIHTAQMREMLFVFFYIAYVVEWLFLLMKYHSNHKAYRNISFEKEAYDHENEPDYLKTRKHFAQYRRHHEA